MPALLALVPFRDWLYIAAIVGLVAFGVYERNHLIDEGERTEQAKLVQVTNQLRTEADQKIATLTAQHESQVEQIETQYATQHQTDSAAHSADLDRLRQYDTYRSQHPVVQCSSTGQPPSKPGVSRQGSDDGRFAQLEQVAGELADAGRGLERALTACMAERATLTGK